ncbi:MAG TPA: hypothetical protein VKT77_11920 [Chthonomonadaceae bacterium]|nr:hypothetical protein [Chthonomonadaceae bacterium]
MDRRTAAIGPAGALLGMALLAAAAQAAGEKILLARHLKQGAVATYKGTIKTNLGGTDIELSLSQKQTIKVLKDNGTYVVLSEDLGGAIKVDGKEEPQMPSNPSTETRDKSGKLVDFAQELDANPVYTPEIHRLMIAMRELVLSDKEVAEGDAWDTLLDNPVIAESKAKVKTVYQGIDKIGGVDAWKFKQTAEAVVNADGSKMTNESTIWVNPKDGLTEKIEGKIKDLPTVTGPIDIVMTIVRARPADGAKAQ